MIALFSAPEPEPLPETDAKLALGALLVRVAKSDDVYLFEEIEQIDRILAEKNGLNPVDAARMRATCEKIEQAAPETEEFARLIRETVEYPHRVDAVTALWKVMVADGFAHRNEEALVTLVETTLGVSQHDSAAARGA